MKQSYWISKNGSLPFCGNCHTYSNDGSTTPYCPWCGAFMNINAPQKCTAFRVVEGRYAICLATKECEQCSCMGDINKCNFYEKGLTNGKNF